MIPPVALRLFRYVLTGGTAALVDLTIFTALHVAGGVSIPVAMTCSFCVSALVNYALASVFVFGHAPNLRTLGLFFVGAMVGYCVNLCVTLGAAAVIPFARILSWLAVAVDLPANLLTPYAATPARACGIAVAFLFNFYLNSTVVFRQPGRTAERPQPGPA